MAAGDAEVKAKAILRLETEEGTSGVRSLEEEMLKVDGVLDVYVNNLTHRIHVWYDPAFLTVEDLKHTLLELTKARQPKGETLLTKKARAGTKSPLTRFG